MRDTVNWNVKMFTARINMKQKWRNIVQLISITFVHYTLFIIAYTRNSIWSIRNILICEARCYIPGKCYSPKMLPNGPMREHKSPRMWHARNSDRGHSLSIDNRTSSLWCMWCQRLRLSIRKKIRSISYKLDLDRSSHLSLTFTHIFTVTLSMMHPFCSQAELNYNSCPASIAVSIKFSIVACH